MLTAQEIREKTFEKAVFGGYEMSGVDAFLEETALSLSALQKEVSVLKTKMKVLVDKIEEYRLEEDAMRNAMVSAQKLSSQMEAEARVKANAILSKAQAEADSTLAGITGRAAMEQEKLETAQRASERFIADMRSICRKQMDLLTALADAMPQAGGGTPRQPQAAEADPADAPTTRIQTLPDGAGGAAVDDGTRVFNFEV